METFISIIVSSIIAIAITWYFTRKQMRKNEICHFSINSYNVGKGLHNEFPKFKLTYDEKEMSDDVLVLNGGFINTGRNDITGLKNDSDINIILPDGCSLKEVQVKRLSSDLSVKTCVDPNATGRISFGIDEKFMSGESFEYIAIIESTKEIKSLKKKIEFKHRIPNTSKIRNEYILGQQIQHGSLSIFNPRNEKTLGVLSLIATLFLALFILSLLFQQKVQFHIYEKGTGDEKCVYLTPQSQLYVSDNDFIPFFDNQTITKEEFNKNYYVTIENEFSWGNDNSTIGIFFSFIALFYFAFGFMALYMWNRKKRIYRLLEQYEKDV